MAKERLISTKFWSDGYVSNLDPVEKLLFLYLLTNERTNISGIYELPLKYIAIETGIDKEMIDKVFRRFEKEKKVIYHENWVAIINFLRHQHNESEKVVTGIIRELKNAPERLIKSAIKIGYAKGMDRVCKGYHILNLTKLNLTERQKNDEITPLSGQKSNNKRGFVPVDWRDPRNHNPRHIGEYTILFGLDGKKYAAPPGKGKSYIPYDEFIRGVRT